MKPYSIDLRKRVIEAYQTGNVSQRQLARDFSIALSTVQAWIQRKRRTGSIAPVPTGGSKPKLDQGARAALARLIETQPDATLAEWVAKLEAQTGISVHPSTLWRQARRLGLTRKKRP